MIARRLLVAVLAMALVAACDDGDDGTAPTTADSPTTEATEATATSESTVSTDAPTSIPRTDPSTTTAPTPTSSPEDALKAEIAADYVDAYYRAFEMMLDPTLDNLEVRVGEVVAPGSPSFAVFAGRMQELVELGDAVVPNDPDILKVTVENVELVGSAPYTQAMVTVCEADNRRQVTLPEHSPNGQEIETLGSGDLLALRTTQDVRPTTTGWLRYESPSEAEGFSGVQTCRSETVTS